MSVLPMSALGGWRVVYKWLGSARSGHPSKIDTESVECEASWRSASAPREASDSTYANCRPLVLYHSL
jgi:hypothetical protein